MLSLITHPAFIILCFFLMLNLLFFFFLFGRLAFRKRKTDPGLELPPVSVIISAKNEDENLRKFLPSILEQDYPVFEVIVVNDQSEDDTEFVLNDFEKQYPNLQIVTLKKHINDFEGKKLALTLGIKRASNNCLLFTDADCQPAGNQWLRHMAPNFSGNTQIVLGYSPYFNKKTLLNLFIQFDTFYTAIQYYSFTLAGMPYMGVGRNMGFTKDLFMRTGYSTHLHIPYGDDDLFVNKNATKENVKLEIHPESFVFSLPALSYQKWKRQKTRHLKAGKEYRGKHKRWLGMLWLSHLLFYLAFGACLVFFPGNYIVWSLFTLRLGVSLWIYGKSLQQFRQLRILPFIPVLEFLYLFFIIPDLTVSALTSRRNVW